MEEQYIVTKNNPHYPDVEYCNTLEEAQAQRDVWIKEMFEEDGQHECKITIAKVIETTDGKSHY